MTLELLSTLAAVGTFIVIAATAIAAVIQLRHMRASNQLTAFMTITQNFDDPEFRKLLAYIRNDLHEKARDPEYARGILNSRAIDRVKYPEVIVAGFFEELGIFVKRRLVDAEVFLDAYATLITNNWKYLEPFIVLSRRLGGPALWENFEYLAVRATSWLERYPNGTLPKNFPRLPLSNEWLYGVDAEAERNSILPSRTRTSNTG